MQIDNTANLCEIISSGIFIKHFDEKTQLECLRVSKKINELMATAMLSDQGVTPNANASPYLQLIEGYKVFCNIFCANFLYPFNPIQQVIRKSKSLSHTITDTKLAIDTEFARFPKTNLTLAVRNKFSAKMIETFLERVNVVDASLIEWALKSGYSIDIVKKLLSKCSKEISSDCIELAIKIKYPYELIVELFAKLSPQETTKCLKMLLPEGNYSSIVEKNLSKLEGKFSSDDIWNLIAKKYSEDIIKYAICNMENNKISARIIWRMVQAQHSEELILKAYDIFDPDSTDSQVTIQLENIAKFEEVVIWDLVRGNYSDVVILKACERLKEFQTPNTSCQNPNAITITCYPNAFPKALNKQYSEETLLKLIEIKSKKINSYTGNQRRMALKLEGFVTQDIQYAQQQGYSGALIKKMQDLCNE